MEAWLWMMTGVGFFIILTWFITYLLYAIPTIAFVVSRSQTLSQGKGGGGRGGRESGKVLYIELSQRLV